jgi:LPXTG-motif cell wall-anchored protein
VGLILELPVTTTVTETEKTVTTSSTETTSTTAKKTTTTSQTTLPQTGYAKTYGVVIFVAALLTFTGAGMVVSSRRKDE